MKTSRKVKFKKKIELIVMMINSMPEDTEEQRGDVKGQEINKDPIIGGADDVYRENPTDDLRDSDLVDTEPLRDEIDRIEDSTEQTDRDQAEEVFRAPSDSEEENLGISNLDDSEDNIEDDVEI